MSAASDSDPLLERIDRLTQVIELAFASQLDAARAGLRADPVDAALIEVAGSNWTPAGRLQKAVESKTKKKKRTVQDRIAHLTERGFLEKRGGGPTTEYRTNPVVGA